VDLIAAAENALNVSEKGIVIGIRIAEIIDV